VAGLLIFQAGRISRQTGRQTKTASVDSGNHRKSQETQKASKVERKNGQRMGPKGVSFAIILDIFYHAISICYNKEPTQKYM
jgi:hypothetical protein